VATSASKRGREEKSCSPCRETTLTCPSVSTTILPCVEPLPAIRRPYTVSRPITGRGVICHTAAQLPEPTLARRGPLPAGDYA
jgi:hypothetical protein